MISLTDEQLVAHADRIKDKVVLITGAASGIGRETALLFASHGAKVVIGDFDLGGASKTVEEITSEGGVAVCRKCDVRSWEDQVALFEFALNTLGSIDVVIPNAGVAEIGDFLTLRIEDGKPQPPDLKTIRVNLDAVLYTTHLALHYLVNDNSKLNGNNIKTIVLIGSMASWQSPCFATLYSTSKHGILGLMRSLGPVCTAKGIRIGSVHPWFADTPILSKATQGVLSGLPLTPVPRIAATILCVATDPNPTSSACPWLLPDHGDVVRLEGAVITEGTYREFDKRIRTLLSAISGTQYAVRLTMDLLTLFAPVLKVLVMLLVGLYLWSVM